MRQFPSLLLEIRFTPDLKEVCTRSSTSESDVGVLRTASELDELARRTGRLGMVKGIAVSDDDDS